MSGRFICVADLHIRSNAPVNRKDDYFETAIGKFAQIVDIANKHKADIICAGDMFDHIKVGHKVVNTVISILQHLDGIFYLVMGQHDLPNHKTDFIEQSPVSTLLFQPNVILLGAQSIKNANCKLFGCSWDEKIPKVKKDTWKKVLVIHKSITPDKPPFFLTDAISAKDMLNSTEYDVIISGDYHVPFIKRKNGKTLINCGPMLRQKINESELKPICTYFNTITGICKKIPLRIRPAEEVFAFENVVKKEKLKFKDEITDLVETLKGEADKPSYKQVVDLLLDKEKPNKNVIDKVKEKLFEAEHGQVK